MLRRYDDAWSWRGELPASPRLSLTWHGTAGFTLEAAGRTLVIDPFLTRPGLVETGLSPLVSNQRL
ncbi:MAG: MBL fold metallo-hydrolase, partial [Myxococcota bacterium]